MAKPGGSLHREEDLDKAILQSRTLWSLLKNLINVPNYNQNTQKQPKMHQESLLCVQKKLTLSACEIIGFSKSLKVNGINFKKKDTEQPPFPPKTPEHWICWFYIYPSFSNEESGLSKERILFFP